MDCAGFGLRPEDPVSQVWMDKLLSTRSPLLALPSKIAPADMGANTFHDAEEFARDEIYRALNELSGTESDQKAG